MIWALIQQVGSSAANYLVLAVLAALVGPDGVGLLAAASVWISLLAGFTDAGLSPAIVQRSDLSSAHLSTAFGINIAVGVGLTVLGVALSWPAAAFFRAPGVQPVMAVLSAGFVIRALGLTQAALAQRELNFRALAIRDVAAALLSGAIGITMALGGYGVWSLVATTLTGAAFNVALLWGLTSWRPHVREFSRDRAAELWGYSSRMLTFNLVKTVVQNTDRLIIGRALSPSALGLYFFANRLLFPPSRTLFGAVDSWFFPKASRLQHDIGAVREYYLLTIRPVMAVILPLMVLAVLLAPVVIVPVFGAEWAPSVVVVQILTVGVVCQTVYSPIGQLMKALGRPGWLVNFSVFLSVLMVVTIGVGAQWGIVGAAWGYDAAYLLALPVLLTIARKLIGTTVLDVLKAAAPAIAATAALAVVLGGLLYLVPGPLVVTVTVALGGAAVAYALVLTTLDPSLTDLVLSRLKAFKP